MSGMMPSTRRDFIQAAGLAIAGAAIGRPAAAADPAEAPARPRPLRFAADMRDGLNPRRVNCLKN